MGPELIQDYGIIGNGRSAALIGRSGSIDWLCWPRFDSPSLFAALLDHERGGRFEIAPAEPFTATRAYARDSNVLVTTFTTRGGEVRLTDLMPILSEEDKTTTLFPEHEILRICECVAGDVAMRVAFQPRPDYARRSVPIRATRTLGFRIEDGPRLYTLRGDRPLAQIAASDVAGTFPLARRRARDVLPQLRSRRTGGAAAARRGAAVAAAHADVVARLGRQVHLRRALPAGRHPQRARAQAARVRALGRDRRRADDVAARADRRRPQLGLPLLLGARRGADGVVAVRPRLRGGGVGVLRLAAAQHAADATGAARPLRRLRRRPGGRGDARSPGRGTWARARCASATARPASCSSTATASWWRRWRRCAGAAAASRARRKR